MGSNHFLISFNSVRMKYSKDDLKPTMTKEEIEEYTEYSFIENFGEGLITYGSWGMVLLLIALTLISLK
jgi:hypothetical protein